MERWAAECNQKRIQKRITDAQSQPEKSQYNSGRRGRGRGRGRGKGRNLTWVNPEFNNNKKRPFDSYTQGQDNYQNTPSKNQHQKQGEMVMPTTDNGILLQDSKSYLQKSGL